MLDVANSLWEFHRNSHNECPCNTFLQGKVGSYKGFINGVARAFLVKTYNIFTRNLQCQVLIFLLTFAIGCATAKPESDPLKAAEFYSQGLAHYNQKNYDKAIELFTIAIEFNPNLSDAYFKRANCHIKKIDELTNTQNIYESTDKAIIDYTSAIRTLPVSYDAYYNRAMALASLARYKDAIKDLLDCVRINQNFVEAYRDLGIFYEEKFVGEEAKAIEYYKKYLEKMPADQSIRDRVEKLEKKVKPDVNLKTDKKDQDEKDAEKLYDNATKLLAQDKKNEALDVLKEIILKYPNTKIAQEKVIPVIMESLKQK